MVMMLLSKIPRTKPRVSFVCNCGKKVSYAYGQATIHKEICPRMK
jgi:hypothetical protein